MSLDPAQAGRDRRLFTGRLVLRDPKDVDHYRALFEFFGSHAMWEDDARDVMAAIADTFRSST